jgi:acetate kinase
MPILTINAGSSSLRFVLFEATKASSKTLKQIYSGHIDAIGQKHCQFRRYCEDGSEQGSKLKAKNHEEAIEFALKKLQESKVIENLNDISKVAHRVVHGGEQFTKPTTLTPKLIRQLKKLSPLAPLHNPANLAAIKACQAKLKKAKHVAIFDTAFHATLPQKAYLYGLPYKLYTKQHIRRYGFHGTSHKYVANEAKAILRKARKPYSKLITCHIGNGVSLAAIKKGICLDTTMGFTPLEGPLMGTRSGSFDPAILFHLLGKKPSQKQLEKTRNLLEKESGFKGMSEISSDVRDLWAQPKSKGTRRTFELFSYQMAKYITSFFTPLGGLTNAIIFTAGTGENAFYLRKEICDQLKAFGLKLDSKANQKNAEIISKPNSTIQVLVIPTNEALQMAREL